MHLLPFLSGVFLTAAVAFALSEPAPAVALVLDRQREVGIEIAKTERLIRRARTYAPPSDEKTHKQQVFARRLKKWQRLAHDLARELERLHPSTTSLPATATAQARPQEKAVLPVPQGKSPAFVGRPMRSKRGIGYNDAKLTTKLNLQWAYNWDQRPYGELNPGVDYVPMLWGPSHASTWFENANAALARGSSYLLAFNEPDLETQANMDVAESVRAWKEYMSPFAGRAKLGSMAVTNGADPKGIAYIKRFFDACPECEQECHMAVVHWYDSSQNVAYFKKHLQEAHALLRKPIWLTEFEGSGSVAQQQAFLKEVIAWMEEPEQNYIERYAGFGGFVGTYVADGSGTLTPLGETYSSA